MERPLDTMTPMNQPEKRYYYANEAGQPVGPFSSSDLQAMVANGILNPAVQVCGDGEKKWLPLHAALTPEHPDPATGNAMDAYHTVAETVGGVPNLRWKDNLFQIGVSIVFAIVGAIVAKLAYQPALAGAVCGFILGVLGSGFVLMVVGWVRAGRRKE